MFAKRVFDVFLAVVVIVTAVPLFILIPFIIMQKDPGRVFFKHERIGKDGRRFMCWKFRTMVRDADKVLETVLANSPDRRAEWNKHHKLVNDPRIIPGIGAFLRRSSLDELPQVFNILRGDMSVTGPRPITPEELPLYGDDAAWYESVKPGLTGLWQVKGRSDTSFEERVFMDVTYAKTRSFGMDLSIILRTPSVVLSGKGAY